MSTMTKQRRVLPDRRSYSYSAHIPERRKGGDRRAVADRRAKNRKLVLAEILERMLRPFQR